MTIVTGATPTVLATHPASPAIAALSEQFVQRFQAEMERVARVAMDAEPTLAMADGWRFDALAGTYVQLQFPAVVPAEEASPVQDTDSLTLADAATED